MEKITLDSNKLKEIASASETAKHIFEGLKGRKRYRHFINMKRYKLELSKVGKLDNDISFMQFWKSLEQLGLGNIIIGRKGKQTRFEWYYDLRAVANAAFSGVNTTVEPLKQSNKPAKKLGRPKKPNLKLIKSVQIDTVTSDLNQKLLLIKLPEQITTDTLDMIMKAIKQA